MCVFRTFAKRKMGSVQKSSKRRAEPAENWVFEKQVHMTPQGTSKEYYSWGKKHVTGGILKKRDG